MDAKLNHLITVRLEKTPDGLVEATTEDLPGLYLIYPTREQILEDLPEAIRVLFKEGFHQDVRVLLLRSPVQIPLLEERKQSYAAIPVEFLRDSHRMG